MENINKIEIRGRVTKIELKMLNSKTMARLTVVTDYVYSKDNNAHMEQTYHLVEAWENTQVKDLTKIQVGTWVRVMGRYRTKTYENAEGEKVSYMEIYADYLKKLADNTTECMNKAEIIGAVTRIELKIVNNRTAGNMQVATNYVFNSKGENKVETTWHNVEAWASSKIKDLAKIRIGSTVKITGRYRKKTWTDPKTEKKRSRYELTADDVKKIAD